MSLTVTFPRRLATQLLAVIILASCGEGSGVKIETVSPQQTPSAAVLNASVTPTAQVLPTATVVPIHTPEPSPTLAIATPTRIPEPSIEFVPAQIVPGGTAVVYLKGMAASATLTFEGRQYQMLSDGNRWWAVVGVGAFAAAGQYAAAVTYTSQPATDPVTTVASLSVVAKNYPSENIELDSETASLLTASIIQAELAQRAAIFSAFSMEYLWSGPFLRPTVGAISSAYGQGRSYNSGPVTDYHHGTDFIGDIGDPVIAAATGRVAFAGDLTIRGTAVILDHGVGVFSAYHHLSSIAVLPGQLVVAGEHVGTIGSTGLVTGPHLHWEVIVSGVEVDGELWLEAVGIGP